MVLGRYTERCVAAIGIEKITYRKARKLLFSDQLLAYNSGLLMLRPKFGTEGFTWLTGFSQE